MKTNIKIGTDATELLRSGVNKAADLIKTTMGPLGRHVSIDYNEYEWPLVTNDGVTVANSFSLSNTFENSGAKYVRQAAQKTNDIAGDGTTTASVLVQAIIEEGMKLVATNVSPVILKRQIEDAATCVLNKIREDTVIIEQDDLKSLTDIATISCRDDELGKMIAEIVSAIGSDGVIAIEDNPGTDTEVERSEGLKVRGGLISPFFVNHKAFQQAVYENVPVIVTDMAITDSQEVRILMEKLANAGHKKAVLIAAQIEGVALQNIIQCRIQQLFDLLPLRVIAYGPIGEGYLRDICAATNATFISEKDGRKIMDFTAPEAGSSEKVVATANEITFIGGAGDSMERVTELRAQLKNVKTLEAESIRERIAKLQSKTASIKVGGILDSERAEIKKRVEDAVNATKAALSDGIVSGGGATLYRASSYLGSDYGATVLKAACQWPLRQIALNADVTLDRSELESIVAHPKLTYDFRSGEVVDAYKGGVIDPAKVVSTALANAVSIGCLFLITNAAVVVVQEGGEEI